MIHFWDFKLSVPRRCASSFGGGLKAIRDQRRCIAPFAAGTLDDADG